MNYEAIAYFLLNGLACALMGFLYGFKKGKEFQWMEDFFNHIKKEAARRDRRGRFIGRAGVPTMATKQPDQSEGTLFP